MSTEEWDAEKEKARERKKIWRQAQKENKKMRLQKKWLSKKQACLKKNWLLRKKQNMSPEELAAKNEKEREWIKKMARSTKREKKKYVFGRSVSQKRETSRENK